MKAATTALLLIVLLCAHTAFAATVTWNEAVDGNWNDGTKWSGGVAPAAGDDAVINVPGTYTVTLDTPVAVKSLSLSDGNLSVAGDFSAGTFTQSGGTFRQISATLPGFTVNDFRLTGGAFIRALVGDGTVAAPYQLTDVYGLQGMAGTSLLNKSFVLANNIDASGTVNWNAGAGFAPVGTDVGNIYYSYLDGGNGGRFYPNAFIGSFNGLGYTISNLIINRPTTNSVGLFGVVYSGGAIRNVGLVGGSVSGKGSVGALVGTIGDAARAIIAVSNSYTTVSVNGTANYAGGLVGEISNDGIVRIENSYATGNVNCYDIAGGLIGYNARGTINNSYATGSVSGHSIVGGLVGRSYIAFLNNSYATGSVSSSAGGVTGGLVGNNTDTHFTSSFWDTQMTGQLTSSSSTWGSGTGLTTVQMKRLSTFSGWSIASTGGSGKIWRIYEGHTAPLLTSFMTGLTLTDAPDVYVTYDGTTHSSATTAVNGVLGAAATGTNVGVYNGYYSTQQGYDISGGNLIIKADQTISFGAAPTIVVVGSGAVIATATSGLAVSFSSTTPAVCSISNGIVTGITADICTIAADQAGNLTYNPAAQVTLDITIGKADQTISFGTAPTIPFAGTGTVSATATSGLAVSFSSTTQDVCKVSGNLVTSITAGSCTIAADQKGNGNYNAATTVTKTINIARSNQTISFGVAPAIAVGGTGTVLASSTSGLAISYATFSPGICTISGSTVTVFAPGTCTIAANQAGDGNYNPAAQVTQNINVTKSANSAPQFALVDGMVTTTFGSNGDFGSSVAVQVDGKIIVSGYTRDGSTYDFALARYNPDGTLDNSFGTGGKVTTDLGATYDLSATSNRGTTVLCQPDGKIVVVGERAIVRYDTNGILDTSFGTGGKIASGGQGGIVQPDGKLLVSGNVQIFYTASNWDFRLSRYDINGNLDATFGTGGRVTTSIYNWDFGKSVVLQPDAKIVVAGLSIDSVGGQRFALARYNANGSLDTTFNGGTVSTPFDGASANGSSVTIQADGKIVVSGDTHPTSSIYDIALARYNSNGSLDTGFDADGKVATDFGGSFDYGTSVIMLGGKVLVAGYSYSGSNSLNALGRYNADGSLDSSFGTNGKVTTYLGAYGTPFSVRSAALQSDGKILVAGDANSKFILVRYNADGSVDTSFGQSLHPTPNFTKGGSAVVLDNTVQVYDPELSISGNYNGASLTLSRNGGANADDLFSSSGTLSLLTQGASLKVGSTVIGTVSTNSAGRLSLVFNSNATQQLVKSAMQQIAYSNSSSAPPIYVLIDWTFSDGNTGTQGTGGALSATRSTAVNITGGSKFEQSITFTPLADKAYGDLPFDLSASADSGLTVVFSSLTDTVCSVSGTTVTLLKGGVCTITADQAGSALYNPALRVSRSFSVSQVPVITSGADTTFTYGEAGSFIVTTTGYPVPKITRSGVLPLGVSFADNGNGTATISGTANVTGPFVFTIIAGSSSGSVSQSFTLTVEATAAIDLSAVDANIVVTPDRHLFGAEFLGDCGTPTTFTVRNIGTTGLTLGTLGLGGINGDQFAFGLDNCSATPLAAGASCTAEVKFCPTSIGSKVALLQIPSDAPKTPVLTAFLHNHESTRQEATRRMPPVLKLLGIPDEMKANTSYTITWSLLGYDEEYLSGIAFFDCSGVPEGSCGESFASNFAYSGNLAPVASVTGDWTYNGVTSSRFDYSYTFTAPSATDIVIRFYRKSRGDNAAGKGSLSLLIPGNVLPPGTGTSYYGLDGRRLLHTIAP